ncbi:hypothetical protein V8G54_026780 [Vigna mungo]|uniref:Uncharacterized protein n=1 Tax=Vigna mungo TaxID=3915 RepID=A0AAQ3N1N2_VIGMU
MALWVYHVWDLNQSKALAARCHEEDSSLRMTVISFGEREGASGRESSARATSAAALRDRRREGKAPPYGFFFFFFLFEGRERVLEWSVQRGGETRGGGWKGEKGGKRSLGKRVVVDEEQEDEKEEEEGLRENEAVNMVVVVRKEK